MMKGCRINSLLFHLDIWKTGGWCGGNLGRGKKPFPLLLTEKLIIYLKALFSKLMTELIFLGSGGGRFATIFQERSTGGLYLKEKRTRIHIDPGPGALVRLHDKNIDPTQTDMILASHAHSDHCNDLQILSEAMTHGGKMKRGVVLASRSVIKGNDGFDPVFSRYHSSIVKIVRYLNDHEKFIYKDIIVRAFQCYHSDPTTIGFKLFTKSGLISYVSDTSYHVDLIRNNKGARILVLPLTRPAGARIKYHLCTEDAVKIVAQVKPELVILNHLGLKILREGPAKEAAFIEAETGVRTIAATDDLRVRVDEELEIFEGDGDEWSGKENNKKQNK